MIERFLSLLRPTEYCALCEERPAVETSADGVPACAECITSSLYSVGVLGNREMRRRAEKRRRLANRVDL